MKKYFTKDRIFPLVWSTVGTGIIFFAPPIVVKILMFLTLACAAIVAVWMTYSTKIILQGNDKTAIFAAKIADNRMKKKGGLLGDILDHVPMAVYAGSWIWNTYLITGGLIGLIWIVGAIQVNYSLYFWNQFNDEDKKILLEIVRND